MRVLRRRNMDGTVVRIDAQNSFYRNQVGTIWELAQRTGSEEEDAVVGLTEPMWLLWTVEKRVNGRTLFTVIAFWSSRLLIDRIHTAYGHSGFLHLAKSGIHFITFAQICRLSNNLVTLRQGKQCSSLCESSINDGVLQSVNLIAAYRCLWSPSLVGCSY